MPQPSLQQEITSEVSRLALDQQERVLEYARSLARERPEGVPGRELTRFAGTIPSEDLDRMMAAIEENCEQVDGDAW